MEQNKHHNNWSLFSHNKIIKYHRHRYRHNQRQQMFWIQVSHNMQLMLQVLHNRIQTKEIHPKVRNKMILEIIKEVIVTIDQETQTC